MNKRDLASVSIIGAAVGLLSQLILSNFVGEIRSAIPLPFLAIRFSVFFGFLFFAPIALKVAWAVGRFVPVLYQFAKFAAVGTLNSFVDIGVLNLETLFLGRIPSDAVFAMFKAISFLIATTNSYFWNKYWTFNAGGDPHAAEMAKFYTIAVTGGLLNISVATFVKTLGSGEGVSLNAWVNLVAPLAGIFAALLWNFVGYKFLVFRKRG